ncbi:unnamed protein product [Oppiella nova]|uniref:Ig-like domain-containing protein n=1 Tax=Oppiella nova TaxID=334625 RepID=A0A7R9LXP4_9ACAR|nr:unnamed protein product [Oppiella nova]CAG2167694.1 unnamed protein product [Oppiella nova]
MIRDNNTVVSGITLERIARGDINSVIRCHAANSELTKAVVKSITIDINLRPLKAMIVALNKDRLTAGRKLEAICHTFGSKPAAVVQWFINERKLTESKDIHFEGNGTKSIVTFVPTPEDNGLDLRCRAENPKLSNSATEDHINLDVKFMPNVTLTTGSSTGDPSVATVNESNEILLNCKVRANPKPTHIRWLFNKQELKENVAKGIIVANDTLIVKNARRESEGRYQCVAYNSEGRGDSAELFVQVFFAPRCVSQQRIIETSISYPTNIFCEVDANPENVTFFWHSSNIEDRRRIAISSKALRSKLTIIPSLVGDFGTYTCWAQNWIGSNQLTPCVFNLTDSGQSVPKPVSDCRVNTGYRSLAIKCTHLSHLSETSAQLFTKETHFHLEVRDSHNSKLIINQTNSVEPVFNVTDMQWAPIYQLVVYVSNPFGVSNEVTMMVQSETAAEPPSFKSPAISPDSQQQQTNDTNSSHRILVILISLLTVVLIILSILITITIVLCFLRQKNNRKRNKFSGTGSLHGGSGSAGSDSEQCSTTSGGGRTRETTKKKYKNKKLSQTNTKTSDDSIATSDGSAHPDVIPCDGVVFYSNDHHIIDDNSCDNGFNANNSLSIYRDIIITNVALDEHNEHRIVNKNLLTNHTNHVSVINGSHQSANNGPDNVLLVQTHHNQCLDTFVAKYPVIDNTNDMETTANYLQLSTSFPQTTPV